MKIDKFNQELLIKIGQTYFLTGNGGCSFMSKADDLGDSDAMFYLGYIEGFYSNIENMLKYYNMAVDKGNSYAMLHMYYYYESIDNIDEMLKYYNIAVSNNNYIATTKLGDYYYRIQDYDNIKKYYSMVVNLKPIISDILKLKENVYYRIINKPKPIDRSKCSCFRSNY